MTVSMVRWYSMATSMTMSMKAVLMHVVVGDDVGHGAAADDDEGSR